MTWYRAQVNPYKNKTSKLYFICCIVTILKKKKEETSQIDGVQTASYLRIQDIKQLDYELEISIAW